MPKPDEVLEHSRGMISTPVVQPTVDGLKLAEGSPLFSSLVKRLGPEQAQSLLMGVDPGEAETGDDA